MRIDKFNLWRYGLFTDYEIDFGEALQNQPDLHIIYGPNEAGKSTLMDAYMDFLFGFPTRTNKDFIHTRTTLKLGATLSFEHESNNYLRLKKQKNSLVDNDETPVDEQTLTQQLSGLGRESYTNMFSLNDDTLEAGGQSILESKGDLGKLLYSATTGVAQLSESLHYMHEKVALFYKKGKKKFELAELKNELKLIDAERKEIDIQASAYAKLVKERDKAASYYEQCGNELAACRLASQKLRVSKDAYPRLNEINRLTQKLEPLTNLPDKPPEGITELKKIKTSNIEIDIRNQGFIDKLQALEHNIESIQIDKHALNAKGAWEQIEIERENYLVARTNLPELQQKMAICNAEIDSSLKKLDQSKVDDPHTLILSTTKKARIQQLIESEPQIKSALDVAKLEYESAQASFESQINKFEQQGGNVDNSIEARQHSSAIEELDLNVKTASSADLPTQFQLKSQQLASLQDQLNASMSALRPWSGDANSLANIAIPHISELQALKASREEINSTIKNETANCKTITERLADTQSQIASFAKTGVIDEAALSQLRAARDQAWLTHKATLDQETADSFEQAMRADDIGQDNRQKHTELIAQLSQLARDEMVEQDALDRSTKTISALEKEQQAIVASLSKLVSSTSTSLDNNITIESFEAWLEERTNALDIATRVKEIKRECASIENQAAIHCKTVTQALNKCSDTKAEKFTQLDNIDTLNALIKQSNFVIKRETALQGLREQLTASEQSVHARKSAIDKAQKPLEKWQADWKSVIGDCWINNPDTPPTTTLVKGILEQVTSLEGQLSTLNELDEKSNTLVQQIGQYHQSLVTIATKLSVAHENVPTDELYTTLQERISSALSKQQTLDKATREKSALLEQQSENNEKLNFNQKLINGLSNYFAVSTIEEIENKLQDVTTKKDLASRLEKEQHELMTMLNKSSLDEAIKHLDDFDADSTHLKLDQLDREQENLEQKLQEAHTAHEQARKAVENIGGDEAVAILNGKRANVLLQIEEKATRHLQLRLALIAADAALKSYRDNHRSSMMQRASSAFSKISCGRYTKLETHQDGAKESLRVIDTKGLAKESDQLSKGTRFQLYLALRIAGYYEYANTRPAVPFIADDIMETFDDERVEQTFSVLGDMAQVGQVIYLTHHKHLCDIAKQAVPNCVIHELG